MKLKLNYLFPLLMLLIILVGCVKNNVPPVVLPTGTFTGTFTRIHLNPVNNKLDTIKANLTLTLSAATGFAVTGDTTRHAGSHGSYAVDGQNIAFSDATLPANSTTIPAKIHLNGLYGYNYSSPSLQIGFSSDTLAVLYNLTAQ
jgi:hypothetical protein